MVQFIQQERYVCPVQNVAPKTGPLALRYQERLLLRLVFGGQLVGNETSVNQYIFMRVLPCSGKMNETKYFLDFAVQAGRFKWNIVCDRMFERYTVSYDVIYQHIEGKF